MIDHLKDILEKLKSDRLWAAVAFIGLVIANSRWHFMTEEQLQDTMWVTVTFIVGKSLRATGVGGIIDKLVPGLFGSIDQLVPDATIEEKQLTSRTVKRPVVAHTGPVDPTAVP